MKDKGEGGDDRIEQIEINIYSNSKYISRYKDDY